MSSVLDKVQQAIGIADFALDVAPTLTPEIAAAITRAELDATAANVEAVVSAYARAGKIVPAKLMAQLLYENERQHPEDTVRGDMLPWAIAVFVALYLLFRKRR